MRNSRAFVLGMIVVPIALCGLGLALAGNVSTPNTFVSGAPALASEVNANFAAHEAAINDNDAVLSSLDAAINDNDAVLSSLDARLGVLLVAHIDGSLPTPVVTRFERRSGSLFAPTVFRLSQGIFLVATNFDVRDRYLFVSPGGGAIGDSAGAAYASIRPHAIAQVRVELKTDSGLVDGKFYISIQ